MLGLIPLVLLIATVCGAFYYWLRRRGLAAEERENPQDRRSVSLLTESLAYFGATLVLAGGGVAVGQAWSDLTDWGHVGIFGCTAMFFLAIGLIVLRIADPAIERMIGAAWFVSAAFAGAAAAIAAHEIFGSSGAVTVLVTGTTIAIYSAVLWLVRKGELQMVSLFAGLTVAVCAVIITIAGSAGALIAVALGLWALGVGWVIVGWQYPQPLWSTVPLGTVVALIGPSFAVWDHGWVFAFGIGTAAVAMAASIRVRSTTLLATGTLALFAYITAVVVRYFHQSLGVPATLAVCGVLLLAVAVIMTLVRRATEQQQAEIAGAITHPRQAEPAQAEPAQAGRKTVQPAREPGGAEGEAWEAEREPVEAERVPARTELQSGQGERTMRRVGQPHLAGGEPVHATIGRSGRDRRTSPTLHLPKAS